MRFIVLSPLQLIKPVSEKVNSEVDKYYNDTFHIYNIYLKKMMHYIYTQIILRVLVLNSMHQRRTTVLIENFFFKKKRVRNTALTYKLKKHSTSFGIDEGSNHQRTNIFVQNL